MAHINWDSVYTFFVANELTTLADTAKHFSINVDYVRQVAAKEKWTSKKLQVRKTALNLMEQNTATDLSKRYESHAQMGRALQEVALQALATSGYKPKSFEEIRKSLDTGIKIEQTSLLIDQKINGKLYANPPVIKYHITYGDGAELDKY